MEEYRGVIVQTAVPAHHCLQGGCQEAAVTMGLVLCTAANRVGDVTENLHQTQHMTVFMPITLCAMGLACAMLAQITHVSECRHALLCVRPHKCVQISHPLHHYA